MSERAPLLAANSYGGGSSGSFALGAEAAGGGSGALAAAGQGAAGAAAAAAGGGAPYGSWAPPQAVEQPTFRGQVPDIDVDEADVQSPPGRHAWRRKMGWRWEVEAEFRKG